MTPERESKSQGVAIVNAGGGNSNAVAAELFERVPTLRVIEVEHPHLLRRTVRAAVVDGAPFVAAIGGDGTLRTTAEVLLGSTTALVPVPGGTRNHFATQVGLESVDRVVEAISSGVITKIDVGDMSGHVFLNNVVAGWYPAMVRRRERLQRLLPKRIANLVAIAIELPRRQRLEVTVNGEHITTWMLFVGNGIYGLSLNEIAEREGLREGVLDVRVLRAEGVLAKLRAAFVLLTARVDRSPTLVRLVAPSVLVSTRPRAIDVTLDGELTGVRGPLEFSIRRGALAIQRPVDAPVP
ncbi:MAG: diacylglycerol kinase family protein [Acidimicrobiales bacterium]